MATSNTRFTQNSLGQSKNPIDSDHGIYRDHDLASRKPARNDTLKRYLLLGRRPRLSPLEPVCWAAAPMVTGGSMN